ncbi:HNH endonuclease [Bisbaumannia pacifica]|uniref:HNH endonuclease n=1 Tax=Bisbaumannia pacifica TaxID=77098 RepID=A0A510XD81_9GAMM|nr:HNH endonuclease [Halomonas pacifica]GEK46490.1 HNH endonuclease [Halomonas pacifica]
MNASLECLGRLRVGHSKGVPAPNKPCLLLAIICEIQAGHIASPRVTIDDRLIARYHDLYEAATGNRSSANPQLPLWHLRNDQGPSGPLWSPEFTDSLSAVEPQLGQPKSLRKLRERFTSARLDATLFEALRSEPVSREACALLVSRYFSAAPKAYQALHTYLTTALESGNYERHPERLKGSVKEQSQTYARSAAFRSLVLEAYDYRCAASRLRYITPDYRYLVEAAHLIPFAESQDDRPTNGIALTPNLHWAMDNQLIAPGPDHRWHVSPGIDTLNSDNRWLCDLDDHPLVLPRDPDRQPCREALAWRLERLLS